MLVLCATSCAVRKSRQQERNSEQNSSRNNSQLRIDDSRIIEQDSVYLHEKGDTVYLFRYRTRIRDRTRIDTLVRTDTIRSVDVRTIKEATEKKQTWLDRTLRDSGILLWILLVMAAAIYVVRRVIKDK